MFFAREIQRKLSRSQTGSKVLDFCRSSGIYNFFWQLENRRIVRRFKEDIDRITHLLSDELSKKTYTALLQYRCRESKKNGELVQEVRLPEDEQYFPSDIFRLSDHESFVDCGAFVGDTIASFIQHTPSRMFQSIHAFEPNTKNLQVLNTYLKANGLENVSTYNLGTYCERKILRFMSTSTMDTSGAIHEDGGEEVIVDSLDHILEGKEITFIKMDVEGAELDSLKGAKELILKNKPKLAICIYHKTMDFITIPDYIHKLVPEYRLYVRHYTSSRLETVLFAVLP